MQDVPAALTQLLLLSKIEVPEDEFDEIVESLTAMLDQIESVYSVDVGDTPPTSMMRVGGV